MLHFRLLSPFCVTCRRKPAWASTPQECEKKRRPVQREEERRWAVCCCSQAEVGSSPHDISGLGSPQTWAMYFSSTACFIMTYLVGMCRLLQSSGYCKINLTVLFLLKCNTSYFYLRFYPSPNYCCHVCAWKGEHSGCICFLCNSRVCPDKVSLNCPFSPRDAEIMQQKQKKADGDGKGGTKTK